MLLQGVLLFGGIMLIAMSAYRFSVKGLGFLDELSFIVPIYLASGFVFGLAVWFYSERMYRKTSGGAASPQVGSQHSGARA